MINPHSTYLTFPKDPPCVLSSLTPLTISPLTHTHGTGPVWKVARYTCAAPVLFGEADDYVDGGVLANNPSESGLTKIQSFYRSRGEKLPVSLVVSVGCGKYPIQTLGNVDFLFVGSQGWSSLAGTSNLMSLLSYAVSHVKWQQ